MRYILVIVLTHSVAGVDEPYQHVNQIEFNAVAECMFAKTQIEQQLSSHYYKFKGVCVPKGL